jgi:hypothetical protein
MVGRPVGAVGAEELPGAASAAAVVAGAEAEAAPHAVSSSAAETNDGARRGRRMLIMVSTVAVPRLRVFGEPPSQKVRRRYGSSGRVRPELSLPASR